MPHLSISYTPRGTETIGWQGGQVCICGTR